MCPSCLSHAHTNTPFRHINMRTMQVVHFFMSCVTWTILTNRIEILFTCRPASNFVSRKLNQVVDDVFLIEFCRPSVCCICGFSVVVDGIRFLLSFFIKEVYENSSQFNRKSIIWFVGEYFMVFDFIYVRFDWDITNSWALVSWSDFFPYKGKPLNSLDCLSQLRQVIKFFVNFFLILPFLVLLIPLYL